MKFTEKHTRFAGALVAIAAFVFVGFGLAACGNPAGPDDDRKGSDDNGSSAVSYTVSFYADNESAEPSSKETVEKGKQAKGPEKEPEQTGYYFDGWFTAKTGGTKFELSTPIQANTLLYARWTKGLTVIFDTQGGSAVENALAYPGKPLAELPKNPTKNNFDFDGWFTDADCTAGNEVGAATPIATGNTTLYAKWAPAWMVQFNTHGGSEIAAIPVRNGNTAKKPETDPTKTGYDFAGWFDSATDGAAFNFAGTPINDNSTIIHAQWTIKKFAVTFAMYDGTPPEQAQTVDWNTTATPPAAKPTKTGHDFVDWYTAETGGEVFNFSTTKITESTTVHARWKIHTFAVTFAMYDGTPPEQPQTIDWNASATRPATDPKKTGYDFDNWYTAETGGEVFNFNTTKITAATTIHARWTIKKLAVTFAMYGGTPPEQAQTVDWNTSVTPPATDPKKTGHDFVDWYTAETGGEVFNFGTTKITESTTVHARWKIHTFAVTFAMYDGTPPEQPQTIDWNASATRPATDPTKTGYDFDDWYTAETGGELFNFNTTKITAATTIHARWTVKKLAVTFAMYDGTPQEKEQSVDWNTTATRPASDPKKTGHDFVDWYTAETGGEVFNFATTKITAATTIHARWKIHTFAVTFAMYGGTPIEDQQTVDWNASATRPATDPTKTGYDFDNWYTAETGGAVFNFNTTKITAATTIHARWTIKKIAVNFAMYGGTPQEQAQSVDWNTTATRPTTRPKKTGHDFVDWYTAETGGEVFNFATTKITESTTVHARWNIHTFAVTFAMYDGTPQEQEQTVDWNASAKRPASKPTKTGYDFDNWYTAETGGEVFNFNTMKITAATTIHARWTIKKLAVTFAMYGGTPQEQPQTVDWNTTATRPTTKPTKTGYDFVDWYTAETGGAVFNFGTTKITAATTIHARWAEKPASGGFTIELVDIIDEAENLAITGPTFSVLSSGQIVVNRAELGVESLEWRYNAKPVDPTAVSTSGNLTTLTLDKRVHGNKIGPHVLSLFVVINGEEYSKFVTFTVTL